MKIWISQIKLAIDSFFFTCCFFLPEVTWKICKKSKYTAADLFNKENGLTSVYNCWAITNARNY